MRETKFIQNNKDKWRAFERALDEGKPAPEKLSELFIQITDDLSYSRTFYPNRSVRVYLNDLAQRIFFNIYQNRPSNISRLFTFWTDELPQLVYESRDSFRLSFLVFALAMAIGILSSAMDPEFAEVMLGEDYVEMTLQNIESGDPMAVYKQRGKLGMSLGITANNLFVAFLCFVMGIFFVVGTLAILLKNGIMVGAFQYFFIERDLFLDSFLTIWVHGTLEISAIIIAGAAGISMGKGLVFPGTLTRLQSFQRSARRGLKIMIGIVPIFIMAGFIEGYLTRHTETPDVIRGLFIVVCLIFILVYFVWFPWIRSRIGRSEESPKENIPPSGEKKIGFRTIKSSGEIFSRIFTFAKVYPSGILALCLTMALLATLFTGSLNPGPVSEIFTFPAQGLGAIRHLDQFFHHPDLPFLPWLNIVLLGLTAGLSNRWLIRLQKKENDAPTKEESIRRSLLDGSKSVLGIAIIVALAGINHWYTPFLLVFVAPFALLWIFVMQRESLPPFRGFIRTIMLLSGQYARALSLILLSSLVGILFFTLMDTFLMWSFFDLIGWIIHLESEAMNQLSVLLLIFFSYFLIHLIFSGIVAGVGLLYYSLLEIRDAPYLKKRIDNIGRARQIQGLERE
ncbi:MAG: stage II sporulation protein M [Saprospiraceae bacterium]|nr:stage II sporulation protein M [Saprospiraceae bacterium]